MTDQAPQPVKTQQTQEDTPAHSTPEEQERLKDFNKDGIPPGSS